MRAAYRRFPSFDNLRLSPSVIPGSIGDPELLSLQTEEEKKTLDPRLKMSRMTEGCSEMCQRISEYIQE